MRAHPPPHVITSIIYAITSGKYVKAQFNRLYILTCSIMCTNKYAENKLIAREKTHAKICIRIKIKRTLHIENQTWE